MISNRDIASIPLSVASLTPTIWLPSVQSLSNVMAIFMMGAGAVLVCLQIAYYWKKLREK